MNEFKGTPGPWVASSSTVFGHGFSGVCSMLGSTNMPIPKANARLIAAAPELLAALQAINDQLAADGYMGTTYGHLRYAAEAAIAKALGETK